MAVVLYKWCCDDGCGVVTMAVILYKWCCDDGCDCISGVVMMAVVLYKWCCDDGCGGWHWSGRSEERPRCPRTAIDTCCAEASLHLPGSDDSRSASLLTSARTILSFVNPT